MVGLMENGVPQQLYIGVRYGHTIVRLQDQSYKILVQHMFQYAEPDKRHPNFSMIVGLGGRIMAGLHDEYARPCPVLVLGGRAGTRRKSIQSLVIVTGVFKQRMLDAKLMKTRVICLSTTRGQSQGRNRTPKREIYLRI